MPKTLKILLLIESGRAYEQGILKGIADYSHLQGPWTFYRNIPRVSGGKRFTLPEIKKLDVDGIIVREQEMTRQLLRLNIPTIVLPYKEPFEGLPNIVTNDEAIGRMAAMHLVDRGFRNFGFVGFDKQFYWSRNRLNGFEKQLSKVNGTVCIYRKGQNIEDWVRSLEKPAAIMTANDDRSYKLFEGLQNADIKVPESVAIIGVGNDEIVCGLNAPPLSSIALNTHTAGYKAAQMLEKMIANRNFKPKNIIIDPINVVERHSTDVLAIEDENVVAAIRFIRDRCNEMIQVDDVAEAAGLSRRQLYNRFKKAIGRTIYQEIRRVKMNQAAKMLVDTNQSVYQIAKQLGFIDQKNISRCFSEEKGMTMLAYRKQYAT